MIDEIMDINVVIHYWKNYIKDWEMHDYSETENEHIQDAVNFIDDLLKKIASRDINA